MNGRHPRQQLLAFVEGRLDPAAIGRVEQHLAACSDCRAEAAELTHVADLLGGLPSALRGLSRRPSGSWPAVWARVQGLPVRRLAPLLNLYVSLAVVVFVLAAALPKGLVAQSALVTAGAVQTPVTIRATPGAGSGTAASASPASTAQAVKRSIAGARAVPNPTPFPGLRG